MRILAIESSAVTASVALMTDGVMTAEYTLNYKMTHSQTLLPMIDEVFEMLQIEPNSVDVVAVSVGPGSFTGLRIGAATGKGIALAVGAKMVGVPTLKALAANMYGTDRLICPIMDARRNHVYSALYRCEGDKLVEVEAPMLIDISELCNKLNEYSVSVVLVGDGTVISRDILECELKCEYVLAAAHMNTHRAGSVAMIANQMVFDGQTVTADALTVDYLRPSQAEREKMMEKC